MLDKENLRKFPVVVVRKPYGVWHRGRKCMSARYVLIGLPGGQVWRVVFWTGQGAVVPVWAEIARAKGRAGRYTFFLAPDELRRLVRSLWYSDAYWANAPAGLCLRDGRRVYSLPRK